MPKQSDRANKMNFKICPRCGKTKPIGEFNKRTRSKDHLTSACRECLYIENKKYRESHREQAKERTRAWNKENPERKKLMLRDWYLRHQEEAKENQRLWRKKHTEEHKASVMIWRKEHPEETKRYSMITQKNRRSTIKGKLNDNIKQYINHSLRGAKNGRHWEDLVGFSLEELKHHLEKQFQPEMNWGNYGKKGWHIDHIIPISAFNFSKPEHIDFKRAWALTNLQPLWAKDNLSKGIKLKKPFQPSLMI
jgi:hypothetical protein